MSRFVRRVRALFGMPAENPGGETRVRLRRIIFQIAVVIFAVEGFVMLALFTLEPFLHGIGITSRWSLVLIDSLALVTIAGPIIYGWVVLPYVTAQQRAERILRDAIENISEGFSMYDAEDRLVLSNSRLHELYPGVADVFASGLTFEQILRIGIERGEYPEAAGREEEWIAEHVKCHSDLGQPSERLTASGRWVKIMETRTADGGVVGIRTDITDLKAREQQLRESEERYRRLIDLSPDGILVHLESRIVYCNAALATILGADGPEQVIGKDALDFMPEEDHGVVRSRRERLARGEALGVRETVNLRMDGSRVAVERTMASVPWQGKDACLILVRDISERKLREHRFRQIVDALQEGFVLYDAEDRLVIWNEKWLELHREIDDVVDVGVTFETLVRAKVARNLLPGAFDCAEDFIEDRMVTHRNPRGPLLRQTHDGRWYVIREVRTEEGGIFSLNIDITELKNAENAAQEARSEAEQAASTKSTFLANMSHELRTPLNAVIGFADLLKMQQELNIPSDNIPEYIDAIHHSGQHLLDLINDLLDFSKFEAGKMELKETELALAGLFAAISEQIAKQAEKAGLQLCLPAETDLPVVVGDELRLRQLFLNLLSNAIKFTPEGGRVELAVSHREDGGLEISVCDTGVGMTEEALCKVGESFRQFDASTTRQQAGTGLGVSIAMALAELHEGRLVYESEPDKGTTATLIFPAHRILPADAQTQAAGKRR